MTVGCSFIRGKSTNENQEEIISLIDFNQYHFTDKQLTQEEYIELGNHILTSKSDFHYSFNIISFGGGYPSSQTSGEYANINNDKDKTSLFLYTSNFGHSKYVESYTEAKDSNNVNESLQTTCSYLTFDDDLECGILSILLRGQNQNYLRHFYDSDKPLQYPSPSSDNYGQMKTSSENYITMMLLRSLLNTREMCADNTFSSTITYKSNSEDYTFTDKPFYSHELNDNYLIIKEKKKTMFFGLPNGNETTKISFCKAIDANDYFFERSFYYNRKTGGLDIIEGSFNTLSSYLRPNVAISGKYTFVYQHKKYESRWNECNSHFDTFRSFPGVEEQP